MKTTKADREKLKVISKRKFTRDLLDDIDELSTRLASAEALLKRVQSVVYSKEGEMSYVEWHLQMEKLKKDLHKWSKG
jgi:predicted  nucleic acid-binding Zn-ribbon protein